jgi:hypothetical protein
MDSMSPNDSDRLSISIVGPSRGHARDASGCMSILAHGGWHVMPEERDLPSAYYRALEAGMGIVVPVRDHDGRLVIACGPASDDSPTLDEFLAERPIWPGQPSVMAIRVCADGLSRLLHRALLKTEGIVPYLFGMSVTDMPDYMDGQIPIFVRQSEHERQPAFYEFAEGVWLDAFERDWYDARLVLQHLRAGKHVAVVSPELHDRSHMGLWKRLRTLHDELGDLSSRLQLCTARPQDARAFFGV